MKKVKLEVNGKIFTGELVSPRYNIIRFKMDNRTYYSIYSSKESETLYSCHDARLEWQLQKGMKEVINQHQKETMSKKTRMLIMVLVLICMTVLGIFTYYDYAYAAIDYYKDGKSAGKFFFHTGLNIGFFITTLFYHTIGITAEETMKRYRAFLKEFMQAKND